MKIGKATAGSGTMNEAKKKVVANIEFAVRASLHEEYVDADFVHSILGKISAESVHRAKEEEVGYIRASLVQFGEAMNHGISTERLGDGIDGNIAEYWELLFEWRSVRNIGERESAQLLSTGLSTSSVQFVD